MPHHANQRERTETVMNIDSKLYGNDLFGEPCNPKSDSVVAQKFLIAPFSVLNARSDIWQDRKEAWMQTGIKGEIGRLGCDNGVSESSKNDYERLIMQASSGAGVKDGVSVFCPVLCELAYRWFTCKGMQIVDPFAGGSVRGVVASMLDRKYWGGELRREQVEANVAQGVAICGDNQPTWICGDSLHTHGNAPDADFVFSCPPYGDLEVYSDDPQDLSAMAWSDFLTTYRAIIAKACAKLKQDRFACFVIGDFRDKKGIYRNFVSETIAAFQDCGVMLYNEAILVTSVGSACMRVTKQFEAGRKFAKTHQNVLVFVKGDWRKATQACKNERNTDNA